MDASFKEQRLQQQQARFQARGATWKGSGRPCTLEFKFDTPEKPQESSTKVKEQKIHRAELPTSIPISHLKEVKKKRELQKGPSQYTNPEQPLTTAVPEVARKRKRDDTFKMEKPQRVQPTPLTSYDPVPQNQRASMPDKRSSSSQLGSSKSVSKRTKISSDVSEDPENQRELEKRRREDMDAAAAIGQKRPKVLIDSKVFALQQPEFDDSKTPSGVTTTTGEEMSAICELSQKHRVPKGRKPKRIRNSEAIEADDATVQTKTRRAPKQMHLVKEETVRSKINHQDASLPTTKKKRILRDEVSLTWNIPLEEAPRRTRIDFGLPLDSSKRG